MGIHHTHKTRKAARNRGRSKPDRNRRQRKRPCSPHIRYRPQTELRQKLHTISDCSPKNSFSSLRLSYRTSNSASRSNSAFSSGESRAYRTRVVYPPINLPSFKNIQSLTSLGSTVTRCPNRTFFTSNGLL